MVAAQPAADLLGAEPVIQHALHEVTQLGAGGDLAGLRTRATRRGEVVCRVRPVVTRAGMGVAADLPAERGRAAAQLGSDRPQ